MSIINIFPEGSDQQRLKETYTSIPSDYSTTVIKATADPSPRSSSILTVRPCDSQEPLLHTTDSVQSTDSYYTASGSQITSATISSYVPIANAVNPLFILPPRLHRFTLVKPGAKRLPANTTTPGSKSDVPSKGPGPWSPFQLLFSSGLLVTRCDVCGQRLGWKSSLECDDCGLKYVTFLSSNLEYSILYLSSALERT